MNGQTWLPYNVPNLTMNFSAWILAYFYSVREDKRVAKIG
jgi:hypothetical protein